VEEGEISLRAMSKWMHTTNKMQIIQICLTAMLGFRVKRVGPEDHATKVWLSGFDHMTGVMVTVITSHTSWTTIQSWNLSLLYR